MLVTSIGTPLRRERAWYTLRAHAPGNPRKTWGNPISSYIRPFTVRIAVRPGTGHYGNATGRHGEAGACARNVY